MNINIDKKLQSFILNTIEEEFMLRNKYYTEYEMMGEPYFEFAHEKFIEAKVNEELPDGYYKLLELFGEV